MEKIIKQIMKVFSFIVELNFIWYVLCVYLFFTGSKGLAFKIVLSILLVYAISTGLIKTIINRRRPYQEDGDKLDKDMVEPYGSSFPSNHTMVCFVVVTLLFLNGHQLAIFALCISVMVAISKIGLKLNYVSDITVGAVLGVMIGFVVNYLLMLI